jgi:hypothetical protein
MHLMGPIYIDFREHIVEFAVRISILVVGISLIASGLQTQRNGQPREP